MSIPLPTVNLTGVSVNQSGTVSFGNIGVSAGGVSSNPANTKGAGTILIYNESGSGLMITFQTSQSGFYLPAGGWQPIPIKAGETGYVWTVIYNLPNPPVTLLLTTYYFPGEPIPNQPTLGNSPIGIGGTISTSSVQTLSNETNSSQTLVIDIGQVGHTQLITINSDGSFLWQILVAGTAHTLMQGSLTADFLRLGQVGDEVSVVDQIRVSGKTTLAANLDMTPGNNIIQANNNGHYWNDSGGTARKTVFVDTTDQVQIQGNSGPGGGHGAVVLTSDTVAVWKILSGSQGVQLLNGTLNYIHGSISGIDGGQSNCGNGTTISHGLGVAPQKLVGTPWIAQPGSATVGMQNPTSTTFQATVGSGTQISWIAMSP